MGLAVSAVTMAMASGAPGAVATMPPSALASASVSFAPASNSAVLEPLAIATGDFNGDGKQDIVTSYFGVQVQLGNGDGTFQSAVSYTADGTSVGVSVADVNGDHKLDILTANDSGDVSVLLGNGDGTFQSARNATMPGGVTDVAAGDLNGDGKLDIVAAIGGLSEIAVAFGNGDGTFGTPTSYATHGGVQGVKLADMDGDKKLDVVTADGPPPGADAATVGVLLNTGSGGLTAEAKYNIGNTYAVAHNVAIADFNGDGKPDVAASNQNCGYNNGDSVVLFNQGGGLSSALSLGDTCTDSVATGDFNGDGIPDVVSSNPSGYYNSNDEVRVMVANGGGTTFQSPAPFSTAAHPRGVAVADFNGDGRPDVATADYNNCNSCHPTSDVSVLLNTTAFPPAGGALSATETYGGSNPDEAFTCPCRGHRADPVDTADGNLSEHYADISIPGRGVALTVQRTYNSLPAVAGTDGPFGPGWSYNYGASLTVNGSAGTATVNEETGSQTTFTLSAGQYTAAPRVTSTLVQNTDGTYTLTRNKRSKLTFSSAGRLVSLSDLNGYSTTLAYDGSGNLSTVTDPAGRTLTFTWSGGHVATVADFSGRTVTYTYGDGAGNLTDVEDVNGGHTSFTYSTSHQLLTVRDPRSNTSTNHYDAQGRVDYQLDQLSRKTTFVYSGDPSSAAGSTTTTTDPKSNAVVDTYVFGVRTQEVRGSGTPQAATWKYGYDSNTLVTTTVTDPNSHVTSQTVDTAGNVLTSTDALNHQTTNTYDSLNDLLTTKGPDNVTSTMTYDAAGNLLTVSRPLVGSSPAQTQESVYTYGDTSHPGDVTSMRDPDNDTWTYTYDTYGNRLSVSDPLSHLTTYTYNSLGWETSKVSPIGNLYPNNPADYTTTYSYADPSTGVIDEFGDLRTITDPLGHVTTRSYDADRNLASEKDADGNVTTYTYDAANELTDTVRADTTDLHTDYNPDGSVLDQVDGAGHSTAYTYDPLGHVVTITDPLSRATTYAYDAVGNLITKMDPVSGATCSASPQVGCTTYGYDAANELTSIHYSDGTTPNVTMGYDADGRRTSMTDGTGSSSYVWDSLHRMTSSTDGAGNTVGYGYDLRGSLTSLTYPGMSTPVTYGYDAAGRLGTVTDFAGGTFYYNVNNDGNVRNVSLPSPNQGIDFWTYDHADQVTGESLTIGGGTAYASVSYTRDANGQLSSETDSGLPGPASTAYTYTPLNQVATAGTSNYGYDSADNPTNLGGVSQIFDSANQLCWAGGTGTCATGTGTQYTDDTRGNRTAGQDYSTTSGASAATYAYDQADRLTTDQGGWAVTYTYNGDGLRTRKESKRVRTDIVTPYTWDVHGSLPQLLYDGTNRYIYGPGGSLLEAVGSSSTTYYHQDALGSIRALTDANGNLVGTFTYTPFGTLAASTGTVTTPFMFAGQYHDSENGFYYLRARYYDPSTAQFLSRDPLVAQTRSPYGYVGGNPMNRVDPTGLQFGPDVPGKCGVRGGVYTYNGSTLAFAELSCGSGTADALPHGSIDTHIVGPSGGPVSDDIGGGGLFFGDTLLVGGNTADAISSMQATEPGAYTLVVHYTLSAVFGQPQITGIRRNEVCLELVGALNCWMFIPFFAIHNTGQSFRTFGDFNGESYDLSAMRPPDSCGNLM